MTDRTFDDPSIRQAPPARPRDFELDEEEDLSPAGGLDDFRDELLAEIERELTLSVPGRESWSVRFSAVIDHRTLNAWRKRSRDPSAVGGVDELRFALTIVAAQARAVLRNGTTVVAGGEPVTFASPALHEVYGVGRTLDCVRAFYGRDADVLAASEAILREAGYAGELDREDAEDPTTRS